MECILQEEKIEIYALIQKQLGYEVALEYIGEMIKIAIGFMQYYKYIVCKKEWVNKKTACNQKAQAEVIKEKYLSP